MRVENKGHTETLMQGSKKRVPCTKRERGAGAVQWTKPTGDTPGTLLAPMAETSQCAKGSCMNHEKKKILNKGKTMEMLIGHVPKVSEQSDNPDNPFQGVGGV